MGIYRLNGNFAVRLKALQLYIYWSALKGPFQGTPINYHLSFEEQFLSAISLVYFSVVI